MTTTASTGSARDNEAAQPPVLSAAGVAVRFAGRGRGRGKAAARAVDGVNLDIAAGQIVALVGESGCGKTTLARTMLGLERPTDGVIRYQGAALEYRTSALRRYRRASPQHPYTRALMSVLPESQVPPVVLTGEPPDATRIPAGCRFHPRCPALASGTAAEAGVADSCTSVALPALPAGLPAGGSMVSCHLAAALAGSAAAGGAPDPAGPAAPPVRSAP